jgi:hypothetical protein
MFARKAVSPLYSVGILTRRVPQIRGRNMYLTPFCYALQPIFPPMSQEAPFYTISPRLINESSFYIPQDTTGPLIPSAQFATESSFYAPQDATPPLMPSPQLAHKPAGRNRQQKYYNL